MPTVVSALQSLAAASVWPLLIFVCAFTLVSIIAVCRAEKADVPQVFASFAHAFGFHSASGTVTDTEDTPSDSDTAEIDRTAEGQP
ncbi:hypothetical protein JK358_35540 [Nocardia sp. 2]|uniref:Uncharacterized protein n=1 Tax=Nocardia acididurans TaxID=2802282 RepID=A0ABS1MGE7_9NOCA|nr:hypothetical protein [Nocardia acididurans]MBL1079728.1 hypothetical protein [Nocardia acididurans]